MVLVTGGAGFIGSHLVDTLMSTDYSVRVVDNLSNGSIENLKRWQHNPRFEFVQADLKSLDITRRLMTDVELVFHLAANPDVRSSMSDPSVHFSENLIATFNILEAMRKGDTAKCLVFTSSSTVYGEADVLPTPENYGPLLPISVYGATKLACEALISSYCFTLGLEGIVLRLANIVGSRSSHGVILDFINKLEQNPSELQILGDGTQTKSYLHVRDLVGAIFTILKDFSERENRLEVYNVGSLDQINVVDIAKIICEEMKIPSVNFRFDCAASDGKGWKGDVKTMRLSVEKLLKLGWKPTRNSEEAVRSSCREILHAE